MNPLDAARAPKEVAQDLSEIDVLTVLQALSDPVRLDIVRQLAALNECMCGELSLTIAKSTASHHLKTLSKAGITGERAVGTAKYLWLRYDELEQRFPGLIASVLASETE